MGNLNHDTDEHPERSMDFEPLQAGRYLAQMVNSEVKPTSSGTGLYLSATFEILEAGYVGKKVFTNFNIKNDSAKAQAIGRGMLSSLCKACGKVGVVDDSSDLHEIPVVIKVSVEPAREGYDPRNEIKAFHAVGNATIKPGKIANGTGGGVAFDDDTIPF